MARLTTRQIHERIRKIALRYPGATEDHPWGETAIKVNGKGFVFMGMDDDQVSMSVKLPQSRDLAHDLPFTEPTHYGMGKYGWVTAHLSPKANPPFDLMEAWIEESYRAVAPKKMQRRADVPSASGERPARRSLSSPGETPVDRGRDARSPSRPAARPAKRRGGR